MTELTLEPAETIRLRLESALASEEVNLVSEAGRGRLPTCVVRIRSVLRFMTCPRCGAHKLIGPRRYPVQI